MTMTAAERQARNSTAFALFVAGHTYQEIANRLDFRSRQAVHQAVQAEIRRTAQRRDLLSERALEVHLERLESLWNAHYTRATSGDHRSAEICRKLLAQQGKLLGLTDDRVIVMPAAAPPADTEPTEQPSGLAEFRKRRAASA